MAKVPHQSQGQIPTSLTPAWVRSSSSSSQRVTATPCAWILARKTFKSVEFSRWRGRDLKHEGAGAEHERLQIPGKEGWVGLWFQNRDLNAGFWILAWNESLPNLSRG